MIDIWNANMTAGYYPSHYEVILLFVFLLLFNMTGKHTSIFGLKLSMGSNVHIIDWVVRLLTSQKSMQKTGDVWAIKIPYGVSPFYFPR